MSEQTLHLVQAIRQRLRAAVRRITLADLVYGLVLTLGIVSCLWLVTAAIEAGLWLDTTPRSILFWTAALAVLGVVAYFLLLPLLRLTGLLSGPTEETVAVDIGARYPEVSDRLVNLLQLVDGKSTSAPAPLIDGAVRMLGEQVRDVPFEQVEDFGRARRAGRLASLPVVGILVFILAAPGTFFGATQRLFSPETHFQRPAPFSLDVWPGDLALVKGASLDITVRATGEEIPRSVTLRYKNADEDHVEAVQLVADSAGVFRHTLVNVRKSLRYRVEAAPVESAWFTAEVTERPIVRSLQVSLTFPAYTGIPPQELTPNVGDVTALPGTRVALDVGVGGRAVQDAFVAFDDGATDTLSVDESRATGSFVLTRGGSYQIVLHNTSGVANSDPIAYALNLLTDAYPSVVIVQPGTVAELGEGMDVPLRVRINDDFGFSRVRLHYRLAESRFGEAQEAFQSIDLPLASPRQLDQELTHLWRLTEETGLDPVSGDVIEYYVQVWDNDTVAGYKSAKSAVHRLRLPSLAEQYEEVEKEQGEAEDNLENMVREADNIRDQFQKLRDELRRKQQGDWEDKRQAEQIQQRQEQLEQSVEELTRQMESMTERMRDNNLVDEETLEKYQELQRVAEEIKSPELMDALRKLQESMENLDLQQMQQSIQNVEFNAEQYKQRLERTLDLFKRLQIEQKLDEASRRAEELAREQQRLAEETKKLEDEDTPEDDSRREQTDRPEEDRKGEQQDDARTPEERQTPDEQQTTDEKQDTKAQQEKARRENSEGDPKENERNASDDNQGEQQPQEQEETEDGQKQGESPSKDELAREQERSSEEMQQLEELMKQIQERMEDMKNVPRQKMQQLNQQTEQQQLPQQMKDNAQQMRQNQMQDARQGQQQMQQQLQQMQQQLQQMQQGMSSAQQQINMAGLRRALSDILTLSQQQESLRGNVDVSAPDSPRLREYAQRQVALSEGLSVVADSLQQLARQIPKMTREVQQQTGDAQRAMSEATTALSERSSREATGQQKTSMMHLNELALLLSDLMQQMSQSSGGQGGMSMQQMLQQLQQMAGDQQKLNQQIQQMLNDMQGNRLSQDMQQRLQQMSAQQQAIRKQLQEMARSKEVGDKALGDLNRIAEQMEETIKEMQRGDVDRRTIDRQQQILTRLLEASRSMRERGKQKERESRQGDDMLRESPAELTPSEQADQLRRALLRALDSGYAPDYEELIKRYFELLQQQQQPAPPEAPEPQQE